MMPLSFESFMLFITVTSQGNLRREIGTEGTTYFEYFFFIVIGLIFLTTFDLMFYLKPGTKKIKFIGFEENLLPKILYWPICLTAIYLVTLAIV